MTYIGFDNFISLAENSKSSITLNVFMIHFLPQHILQKSAPAHVVVNNSV